VVADVLAQRPIIADVAARRLDQLASDAPQRGITKHRHRAVARLQGVVERQLVLGEAQGDAAVSGCPHVARESDQLLDRPILVLPQGALPHLGERARLHHVLPAPHGQIPMEQLLQQLHRHVPPRQAARLRQELVAEDRDVGLRETRRREDVDHAGTRSRNPSALTTL
jgi:hypothetical protein